MKHFFLIPTFLLLSTFVSGQTWAPTGAKWTYEVRFAFSGGQGYREWISIGEVLTGGKTCKLIERQGYGVSGELSNQMITYEDSNVVYWYNTTLNQFTVLYDFNKNAGETWLMTVDTCDFLITVDSTGMDTINGFGLKVLYIYSEVFWGKVIQYIGNIYSPMPDIFQPCYGWHEDMNYYAGMRCYEDTILGFHSFGIAPSCDYTTTGIAEIENDFGLSLFPNPTGNRLSIQTKSTQYISFSIYNSFGQLIEQGNLSDNHTTIDITNYANGIYSMELRADNNLQRKRFIVQK